MNKLFKKFKSLFSNKKKTKPNLLSPAEIKKLKDSRDEFGKVLDNLKTELLKIEKDKFVEELKINIEKQVTVKKPAAKKPAPKTATAKKATPATKPTAKKPAAKKATPKKPAK
jgi:predicted metal-binding transcription factor (methanogenesis marker protein 9)